MFLYICHIQRYSVLSLLLFILHPVQKSWALSLQFCYCNIKTGINLYSVVMWKTLVSPDATLPHTFLVLHPLFICLYCFSCTLLVKAVIVFTLLRILQNCTHMVLVYWKLFQANHYHGYIRLIKHNYTLRNTKVPTIYSLLKQLKLYGCRTEDTNSDIN